MTDIAILSSNYHLLIYLLLNKKWKKTLFVLNEAYLQDCLNIKKIKKYIYKGISIKSNLFLFYKEKVKFYIFLLKNNYIFNKNIRIYGIDHLEHCFLKNRGYFLIEDGIANYLTYSYKAIYKLKKIIRLENPFYKPFGYSKYIKKIYLTGIAPIPEELKNKVEIINLKELWNKKNEIEKEEILNVFGFNTEIIKIIKNKNKILYTQPLSEDKVISEEEKIELYKKIVRNYNEKELIIKKHPREKTNYKKIFPEIEVLNQNFPAELFNLLNIKFKKVITIFSTAALSDKEVEIDFYGTEIHPKILKRFGSSESIMAKIRI